MPTPRPPSPRATPAARTTAPPCASSPHPSAPGELGLRPLGRLVSWGVAGVAAEDHGHRPGPRHRERALAPRRPQPDRHGPHRAERGVRGPGAGRACASGTSPTTTSSAHNVNGSGISLGHPVGATGGRILATLLREMDRRDARYGLETMCIGGGQGLAAVFERVTA